MASPSMVRKQVYLTAGQDARLRRAASGIEKDSLFRLVGAGTSEQTDLSERVDELLYGRESGDFSEG